MLRTVSEGRMVLSLDWVVVLSSLQMWNGMLAPKQAPTSLVTELPPRLTHISGH